jgi:hypothetical protein
LLSYFCNRLAVQVGAGVADLGAIGLMPFSTPLTSQTLTCVNTIVSRSFKPSAARLTNREDDQLRVCNFLQSFTHQDEAAQPGYYRVWTQGQDSSSVQTELTATPHSGAHRWSFSNTQSASLILDLCHGLSYSANNCVNARYFDSHRLCSTFEAFPIHCIFVLSASHCLKIVLSGRDLYSLTATIPVESVASLHIL